MSINIATLLSAASAIATHPVTKGTAIASVLSGAVYIAGVSGILITQPWMYGAATLVGIAVYKLLPAKEQQEVDNAEEEVINIVKTLPIPSVSANPKDFPNCPPQLKGEATPNNLGAK